MSFHSIHYEPPLTQENSNSAKTAYPVFTVNERPMIFYIPKSDPKRDKYCKLINENGGIVAETPSNNNNGIILLSSYYLGRDVPNAFKTEYVKNSVEQGVLLPLENYRWTDQAKRLSPEEIRQRAEALRMQAKAKTQRKKAPRLAPTRTSLRYTKEQDQYILEQVRLDPKRRGTHQLYKELAEHPILEGHTGNSLRSRFRAHLADRLEYVYEVDDDGNLVYDAKGNKIRKDIDDDVPGMKRRFTGEDDYNLCSSIVRYNDQRINQKVQAKEILQEEAKSLDRYAPVPFSFFTAMQDRYGRHTAQSWRDRWRKFALVYGIQRYLDECFKAKKHGEPLEPMKNLTGRRTFSGVALLKQNLGTHYDQNAGALDEEIGEVKSSNIDDVLQLQNIDPIDPPVLLDVADESLEPKPKTPIKRPSRSKRRTPRSKNLDDRRSGEMRLPQTQDASQLLDTESQSLYAEYFEGAKTITDLFSNALFEHTPISLRKGLDAFENCEDESPADIFKKLSDLGFKAKFIGHMFKATSMQRPYLVKYVNYICRQLQDAPKLIVDPTELLKVQGVEGIWNQESDALIYKTWPNYRSDAVPELVKVHGKQNVDARNEFLTSLFS